MYIHKTLIRYSAKTTTIIATTGTHMHMHPSPLTLPTIVLQTRSNDDSIQARPCPKLHLKHRQYFKKSPHLTTKHVLQHRQRCRCRDRYADTSSKACKPTAPPRNAQQYIVSIAFLPPADLSALPLSYKLLKKTSSFVFRQLSFPRA